jgi:hypothetical protein
VPVSSAETFGMEVLRRDDVAGQICN